MRIPIELLETRRVQTDFRVGFRAPIERLQIGWPLVEHFARLLNGRVVVVRLKMTLRQIQAQRNAL